MSDRWPKIWGTNAEVYCNDLCSVNILKVKKRGTCSYHSHKSKHNIFHVLSGQLKIITDIGESVVGPDQSFTVFAGTKHQFQAVEETIAIEVMFVHYDAKDINRESVGYLNEEKDI